MVSRNPRRKLGRDGAKQDIDLERAEPEKIDQADKRRGLVAAKLGDAGIDRCQSSRGVRQMLDEAGLDVVAQKAVVGLGAVLAAHGPTDRYGVLEKRANAL